MIILDSPDVSERDPLIWFVDLEVDNNYNMDFDYISYINYYNFVEN